jgi:hypothetical protein
VTTTIPVLRPTTVPPGALRKVYRQLARVAAEWAPDVAREYRGQLQALTPHLPLTLAETYIDAAAAALRYASDARDRTPYLRRVDLHTGGVPDQEAAELRRGDITAAEQDARSALAALIAAHPYAPLDGTPLAELVPELAGAALPDDPAGLIPTDRDLHAEQHGYSTLLCAFPELEHCPDYSTALARLIRLVDQARSERLDALDAGLQLQRRLATDGPINLWPVAQDVT